MDNEFNLQLRPRARAFEAMRKLGAMADLLRFLAEHKEEIAAILEILVRVGVLFAEDKDGELGTAGSAGDGVVAPGEPGNGAG